MLLPLPLPLPLLLALPLLLGPARAAAYRASPPGAGPPDLLFDPDCGRLATFKFDFGNITDLEEHPWLGLLEYNTPRGRLAACGAVLLTPLHLVTAAHCVAGLPANWTLRAVRLGEYDTASSLDCFEAECAPAVQRLPVAEVRPHERYNGSASRAHDLALLRLARPARISDFVRPACLPRPVPELPRQRYEVAGWGHLAGRRPSRLRLRAYLLLANVSECRDWYGAVRVHLSERHVCAGGHGGDEHPCIADSGGPLLGLERASDGSHRLAVFGVLTMDAKFCDDAAWPGVFTSVLPYRDWIIEHIRATG